MIDGAIASKLQCLDEVPCDLRSWGPVTVEQLQSDRIMRRVEERDLQILLEVLVDVCQRVISLAGQVPAPTGLDAIERCLRMGVLSDAELYREMIHWRTPYARRETDIDVALLVAVINDRLADFERFRDQMLDYYKVPST